MTLHYRKLLIASILFPMIVTGLIVVSLPSLMQARSSSTFGKLRGNIKTLEMQATLIDVANSDDVLNQPIDELLETIANQQDTLVDLRDVLLSEADTTNGPGWIAMTSALVGIVGTLSSLLLSWRQDMRQARSEAQQPNPSTASQEPTTQAA